MWTFGMRTLTRLVVLVALIGIVTCNDHHLRRMLRDKSVSESAKDRAETVEKILADRTAIDSYLHYQETNILKVLSNMRKYVHRCDKKAMRAIRSGDNMMDSLISRDRSFGNFEHNDPIKQVFYHYRSQNTAFCSNQLKSTMEARVKNELDPVSAEKLPQILGGIREFEKEVSQRCSNQRAQWNRAACMNKIKLNSSFVLSHFLKNELGLDKLKEIKHKVESDGHRGAYVHLLVDLLKPHCKNYQTVFKTEILLDRYNGMFFDVFDLQDNRNVATILAYCDRILLKPDKWTKEIQVAVERAIK